MKKYIFVPIILMLVTLLFSQSIQAQELKTDVMVVVSDLEILTGETLAMPITTNSIAGDTGYIFFIGQNSKTGKLKWHLYNPFEKKMIKEGECLFESCEFNAISTKGSFALAFSQSEQKLWLLDINNGKWDEAYKNPEDNEAGLAFSTSNPFSFVSDTKAFAIFDQLNKKHTVTDTSIVELTTAPFKYEEIIQVSKMMRKAVSTATGKDMPNPPYTMEYIQFCDNRYFLCAYRSNENIKNKIPNSFLIYVTIKSPAIKLYEAEKQIMPLDLKADGSRQLFSIVSRQKGGLFLRENKKISKPLHGPSPIAGKVLKSGNVAAYAKDYATYDIYLGPVGAMKKVLTFARQYPVVFIDGVEKMAVIKDKTVSYYNL